MTRPGDALDARRLPRAAGWRLAYLLVQGGASVVVFVLLGHLLPGWSFAPVAVAQGVLVLAQAVGDFGLSQAATTALTARVTTDPTQRGPLAAATAVSFYGGALLAGLLTLGSALLLSGDARTATAMMAPAAAATVLVAGADGLLRSDGQFARPFRLMAASRLGAFAGVVVALWTDAPAAVAAGVSGGTVLASAGALRYLLGVDAGARRADVRWLLAACLPLGLSAVLVVASARLDTLVLGGASTVREAAAFEAAWRLYQLGQYAGGVLATAGAPFMARAIAGGEERAARRLVVQLLAVAAGLGVLAAIALALLREPLGDAFYPSNPGRVGDLLPLLAVATPLGIVGQVVLAALSVSEPGRRTIPMAFLVGAVLNLVIVLVGAADEGATAAVRGAAIGVMAINLLLLARCGFVPPFAAWPRGARRSAA